MSKKSAKSDLFSLIKSMSKQEKRHFSIDSLREGGDKYPTYIRLFEAFNSMEQFSQEDLIKACKNESYLPHLSSKCDYLKEKILQSLLYHRNKKEQGPEMELRSILDEIEILFDRNLHFFCRKKLRKGRELAEQFGLPGYLLEILTWERRLLRGLRIPRNQKELAQTKTEEDFALKQLEISTQLIQILDEVSFPKEDPGQSSEQLELIDEIPCPPEVLTFKAKRALNELKAIRAVRQGNQQLALEKKKDNYLLWKHHPIWLQRHPDRFIAACNSYLIELNTLGNYSLFREVMDEARSNTDIPGSSRVSLDITLSNAELIYHLNLLNPEGLLTAADSFSKKVDQHKKLIGPNKTQTYFYNLGLAYYLAGNKPKSKASFQKIINIPKSERIQNLQDQAFLWRQVILYEIDIDGFQYFYKQANNHFKKLENSPGIALPLLKCMNKNIKSSSVRIQIQNFKSFYDSFGPDKNPAQNASNSSEANNRLDHLPQYQLFFKWVKSKLQDKSFLELLKE